MKKKTGSKGAGRAVVGVVMGSDSDWPIVEKAVDVLGDFGVPHEVRVISAHRTPAVASSYAKGAAGRGIKVIIAAAGGAAHLGGVLAAHTILPVIGIPVKGGALNGLDALLATLQMPSGIPVATVTLGSAGPVNAAVLAVQILAGGQPSLNRKLASYKQKLKAKVAAGDKTVRGLTKRRK
jgi:5-(carboxyamino)imidazole ribonucleotide mutase